MQQTTQNTGHKTIQITPSGQACGAVVTGVDLAEPLLDEEVALLRTAWLTHHVLSFPQQQLDEDQFEAFALQFGRFGRDEFFGPIPGRQHIAAIKREAEDTNPLFAESWHSDWSFQSEPPAATCLYGLDIPPVGGDTLFANQHLAWEAMPAELKQKFRDKIAIHSAVLGYAPDGPYGDKQRRGSMDIRPSAEAYKTQNHPLVRPHPESGKPGIFGAPFAYIVGFEGLSEEEAKPLLLELNAWQTREAFIYRHQWHTHTLVMWDNRSVLHRATGGYEGYRRELHRITINA